MVIWCHSWQASPSTTGTCICRLHPMKWQSPWLVSGRQNSVAFDNTTNNHQAGFVRFLRLSTARVVAPRADTIVLEDPSMYDTESVFAEEEAAEDSEDAAADSNAPLDFTGTAAADSNTPPDFADVFGAADMFVPPGASLNQEDKPPLRRLPGSNIYLGPHATNSRIKQAEFVKSSTCTAECPQDKLPEFALVGRSNVGKSSLINTLVQRKDLAQTSKKPGKTQLINHFIINNSWYLVDLPGYGYAKVPASIRASWDIFTKDFFVHSRTLVCVMLLVDASVPPQQIDLEYADWLHQHKIPLTIVFTKCDRKKKKKNGGRKAEENVKDFLKLIKQSFGEIPPWIMTSCVTNQGKDPLLLHIAQLRNYWTS